MRSIILCKVIFFELGYAHDSCDFMSYLFFVYLPTSSYKSGWNLCFLDSLCDRAL